MQEPKSSITQYTSYLLRLRWSQQEDEWVCQSMLTNVVTKEEFYFADLVHLFAYLHEQKTAPKGDELSTGSVP